MNTSIFTIGQIFSIGHSTRTLEEFLQLPRDSEISLLVDVRKLPGSRNFPRFNEDVLADALLHEGVEFRRSEPLTGRWRRATHSGTESL